MTETKKTTKTTKAKKEEVIEEVKETKIEKPIEKKEESITEKAIKNVEKAKKTGTKKAQKKTVFDEDDMVPVASLSGSGQLNHKNPSEPYDRYTWFGFGDVQMVRYGTLKGLKDRRDQALGLYLYILDEEVIKALGLKHTFDKLGSFDKIAKILDQDLDVIINFIDNNPKELGGTIRRLLIDKMTRKENIDYFKLKVLAEKLDIDLEADF